MVAWSGARPPWRTAASAAALVGWATLRATVSEPRERLLAWATIALGVAAGSAGLVLAGPAGALVGVLAAPVLVASLVMGLALTVETSLFRRADRVWLTRHDGGRAVARATHRPTGSVPDGTATGGDTWRIFAVAAAPARGGWGSAVMRRIVADADAAGATCELTADTRRLVGWYRRFGFAPVGGPAPGARRLLRRDPSSETIDDGF